MPVMLLADDNVQITSILEKYALKEGFAVRIVHDGAAAVAAVRENKIDIVLLDIMMPLKDGFQVCREIRTFSMVPVIMLTARGEDFEKIMGLDIGADDYIVKPFSSAEVMARVRSILRRVKQAGQAGAEPEVVHTVGELMINLTKYEVRLQGEPIELTKKEFELLWTLATNKNRAFTRDVLLNQLWGYDYYGDNRTVDSHIKRLRSKLDARAHPDWEIKTIRGVGYRFEESIPEK